jgi:hypothetical protein
MADEDQRSVLWHGSELAPNRLHLLSPVGNVRSLVIAHEGGNNCLSAALFEVLGNTCPGERPDERAVDQDEDAIHWACLLCVVLRRVL